MFSWLKRLISGNLDSTQGRTDERFIIEQIPQITALADRGRLETASRRAQKLTEECPRPDQRAICGFNFGVMHWTKHGDGLRARAYWLKTAEILQQLNRNRAVDKLHGDCCENLMLHSLDYAEYERWASRLATVHPEEPILRMQLPKIAARKLEGIPWYDSAHYIADSYFKVEPNGISGQPPCAASILHLLLAHREKQRLPREAWRKTLLKFVPLRLLVTSEASRGAVTGGDPESSAEITACLTETKCYLEEFLSAFSGDALISQQIQHIDDCLVRMKNSELHKGSSSKSDSPRDEKPVWIKSAPLLKAISKLELGNAKFELVRTDVLREQHFGTTSTFPFSLRLTFRQAADSSPIPVELEHQAGLILRCIAGLTVPLVASRTPSMQVSVDRELAYSVNVGDGVPLHLFDISVGDCQARFLEMRSDEDEGFFNVYVTPSTESLKAAIAGTEMRRVVMTRLASAFERFFPVPVLFGKEAP